MSFCSGPHHPSAALSALGGNLDLFSRELIPGSHGTLESSCHFFSFLHFFYFLTSWPGWLESFPRGCLDSWGLSLSWLYFFSHERHTPVLPTEKCFGWNSCYSLCALLGLHTQEAEWRLPAIFRKRSTSVTRWYFQVLKKWDITCSAVLIRKINHTSLELQHVVGPLIPVNGVKWSKATGLPTVSGNYHKILLI